MIIPLFGEKLILCSEKKSQRTCWVQSSKSSPCVYIYLFCFWGCEHVLCYCVIFRSAIGRKSINVWSLWIEWKERRRKSCVSSTVEQQHVKSSATLFFCCCDGFYRHVVTSLRLLLWGFHGRLLSIFFFIFYRRMWLGLVLNSLLDKCEIMSFDQERPDKESF